MKSRSDAVVEAKSARGVGAWLRESLRGDPVRLLSLLAIVFASVHAWQVSRQLPCMDYFQFWVVGRAVRLADAGDIYTDAERERLADSVRAEIVARVGAGDEAQARSRQMTASQAWTGLHTYSTPWLYTLFGLSVGADFNADVNRFQALSVLCFVLAVACMCRILGYSLPATALWLVLLLLWFQPALSDMRVGNVNRVQLGLLALFLWIESRTGWRWRHVVAGVVLGSACMFKPNLAFVALVLCIGWAISQQYRKLLSQCVGMAIGALLSFAASSWFFGSPRPWWSWATQMPKLMDDFDNVLTEGNHALMRGNFALARVLHMFAGITETRFLQWVFLALIGAVLVYARRRQSVVAESLEPSDASREVRWDLLLIGLGGSMSLLASQLSWLHYFVFTVPLALYLLRPSDAREEPRPGTALVRGLALVSVILIALETLRVVFVRMNEVAATLIVCGGTLLLFTLALIDAVAYSRQPRLAARGSIELKTASTRAWSDTS